MRHAGQDRVADFEMKLMEIDQEQLGIPDQEYSAQVTVMRLKCCVSGYLKHGLS